MSSGDQPERGGVDDERDDERDHGIAHYTLNASAQSALDAAGIEYAINPRLVRGLDYYTRTVFEFSSDALGAQSGVGGGGRYDRLIEQIGGDPTPGVGWATGLERIAQAMLREPRYNGLDRGFVRDSSQDPRAAAVLLSEWHRQRPP